jgi:hypothetical protein
MPDPDLESWDEYVGVLWQGTFDVEDIQIQTRVWVRQIVEAVRDSSE